MTKRNITVGTFSSSIAITKNQGIAMPNFPGVVMLENLFDSPTSEKVNLS